MKKRLVPVVVAIIMLIATPASTQGSVPPGVTTLMDNFDSGVASAQAANMAAYGRYMQYLRLSPADASPACPNDQAACPVLGVPPVRNADFVVNVYLAPDGWGYEVVGIYTATTSVVYTRTLNHGPETHRAHDWTGGE